MKLTKSDWLIPAALIFLSMVPALAGGVRVAQLAGGAEVTSDNARFFAAPVPVLIHIPAAIIYSILGAFQFSPGIRRRNRGWHRSAGRILIPAGLLVAISGLWMTLSYPWPAGDGHMVYAERLIFGSAMLLSIGLGVRAIQRRAFATHGEWMMRAYAIALGAGTQVLTHLPWFVFVESKPGELARGVMMGAGWLINIIFVEWIIRRQHLSRPIPRRPSIPVPPTINHQPQFPNRLVVRAFAHSKSSTGDSTCPDLPSRTA